MAHHRVCFEMKARSEFIKHTQSIDATSLPQTLLIPCDTICQIIGSILFACNNIMIPSSEWKKNNSPKEGPIICE